MLRGAGARGVGRNCLMDLKPSSFKVNNLKVHEFRRAGVHYSFCVRKTSMRVAHVSCAYV